MSEENVKDWLDELCDTISEELADHKQVKFSTHKNRKLFSNKICGMIKDAVHKNTLPRNQEYKRATTSDAITRPVPGRKSTGFAVMTEELSSKGDETLANHIGSKDEVPKRVAEKKRGVNTW